MSTTYKSTSDIVSSHVFTTSWSSDELVHAINKILAALQALEVGRKVDAAEAEKAKNNVQLK
jgi:predicted transcriptional regulator